MTNPSVTANSLPGTAATAADGGREMPFVTAAVRNVVAFPARLKPPCRMRLAGEVMLLPVIPCFREESDRNG